MSNRGILTEMIKTRLQDEDSILGPVDLDDALTQALSEYSRRRPYARVHELTGDAVTRLFAVPSDWQRDWSRILSVEQPAGEDLPTYVAEDQWSIYQETDDTLKLRLVTIPSASETVRVRYTTLHLATSVLTSVPSIHHVAMATLGAAIAAHMIAVRSAAQSDSSFAADTSDHAGRSERFATRSQELRERFDAEIPDPTSAAGARRHYLRVVRT